MVNTLEALEVIPTGKALGAEIRGIDFAEPVPADVADKIKALWAEHMVLLLRGQVVEKTRLLEIADMLGGRQETGSRAMLIKAGMKPGSARISDVEGVSLISNLDEDGKPRKITRGSGSLEIGWHTDNSYIATPPMGSILNAIRVPVDGGGHTAFCNMVLAYETLPDDLKAAVEGKHMCHDNTRNTVGRVRDIFKEPTCREEVEGPVHSMVRIHPITGKRALYLSRRHGEFSAYIVELSDAESDALQERLWAHAAQEKFTWTHTDWKPGDMVMWDNQQVLHRRSAIDPTQARLLQRTLVKAERFISAWDGAAAAE
jgi:taurine dioxygenase